MADNKNVGLIKEAIEEYAKGKKLIPADRLCLLYHKEDLAQSIAANLGKDGR